VTAKYLRPLVNAIGTYNNATELINAISDFIEAQEKLTTMQRLQQTTFVEEPADADILHHLIVDILVAHKETTDMWRYPGHPSLRDYASQVVQHLRRRYDV
jgi:hypothetical protein